MSKDDKSKLKMLGARPGEKGGYEVGFGKPPKETRFRKGQSGNPRGRPKGAKTKPDVMHNRLQEIVLREAYREVPLREGTREIRVPIATAVMKSIAVNAARGNIRFAELFAQLLSSTERAKSQEHDAFLEAAIIYKTEWAAEIARCKKLGLPEPELDIHPDQIVLDLKAGAVDFIQPITEERREELQEMQDRKVGFQKELVLLQKELSETRDAEETREIRSQIARAKRMLDIIVRIIPDDK